MKTWTETLTLAALAATLTLAGCAEDGPGSMIEADEELVPGDPGDPAIYAPDGWPFQIGDFVPDDGRESLLAREFPRYGGIDGMHLVGGQVYGARFGERVGPDVYEGHFPKKARWRPERDRAEGESRLPERFRGKIEYREPASFIGFDEDGEPYIIRDSLAAVWPHVLTDAEREEMEKQREEERRKR